MRPDAPSFDAPAAEWLVYADALQQQGDPRGELIALEHAGDLAKRDAFVRAHAQALLGDAAAHFPSGLGLSWRWGFLDSAAVRGSSAEVIGAMIDALLGAPVAGRLRTLSIGGVPAGDEPLQLASVVERLATRADRPLTLTALELVDARAADSTSLTSRDFDPRPNLVDFGPLQVLWNLPWLRELELVVADTRQLVPGTIVAPQLTSLTIHGLRFAGGSYGDDAEPSDLAQALAIAKLPKLEVFDARLCEEFVVNTLNDDGAYTSHGQFGDDSGDDGGNNEGADWPGEFGDALRNLVTSPLRRLALTSFDTTDSLLELIESTGLPPTLKELDLSDSSLSDADLPWFVEHKALLAGLERLVVKNTGFTDAGALALAALGPKIEHSHREPATEPFDEESGEDPPEAPSPLPLYRYVIGME